jgi:hypothetical protein
VFRHHVFIGMATDTLALVQHKTRLYLLQVPVVTTELVYQQVLRRFGALAPITLSSPAPVKELMLVNPTSRLLSCLRSRRVKVLGRRSARWVFLLCSKVLHT